MRRRKPHWSAVLAVFTCLAAVWAVIHVAKPAWYASILESLRRRSEGWEVLKQGDFEAVGLYRASEEYSVPSRFPHRSGLTVRSDTSSWFYFLCGNPVGTWESSTGLEGKPLSELPSYARIETPSGASTIVGIQGGFDDPYLFCVQIPGQHPPDTEYLDLTLSGKQRKDTVVRLYKPGRTIPIYDGPPKDSHVQDGVTIKGRANAIKAASSDETVGVEWSLSWKGLSSKLVWSYSGSSSGNVFQPSYHAGKKRTGGSGFNTKDGGGQCHAQALPYSADLKTVPVYGVLQGYEVMEETVDFGTFRVIESGDGRGSGHGVELFLDLKAPIVRTTPSGLRIVLEPLLSPNVVFHSGSSHLLYFAMRVEPGSLPHGGSGQSFYDAPVRIEVGLESGSQWRQIEPLVNPGRTGGGSQVVLDWAAERKSVHMKLRLRRLDRRQVIPFQLNIPIDHKHRTEGLWHYPSLDLGIIWQGEKPGALKRK